MSTTFSNLLNLILSKCKIIQGLKHFYGGDSIDLMETYTTLSSIDRKKVLQYADDMILIYGNINK